MNKAISILGSFCLLLSVPFGAVSSNGPLLALTKKQFWFAVQSGNSSIRIVTDEAMNEF
jgi:hypothetical protein